MKSFWKWFQSQFSPCFFFIPLLPRLFSYKPLFCLYPSVYVFFYNFFAVVSYSFVSLLILWKFLSLIRPKKRGCNRKMKKRWVDISNYGNLLLYLWVFIFIVMNYWAISQACLIILLNNVQKTWILGSIYHIIDYLAAPLEWDFHVLLWCRNIAIKCISWSKLWVMLVVP